MKEKKVASQTSQRKMTQASIKCFFCVLCQHVRLCPFHALPSNTVAKSINQLRMHIEERVAAIVVMLAIRSDRQKVLRDWRFGASNATISMI